MERKFQSEKQKAHSYNRRRFLKNTGAATGSLLLFSGITSAEGEDETVSVPSGGARPTSEVIMDSSGGTGVRPKDVLSGVELARIRGKQGRPPDHAGEQGPPEHANEQGPPEHSSVDSSSRSTYSSREADPTTNPNDDPGLLSNNSYLAWTDERFYNGAFSTMSATWTVPDKPTDYIDLQNPNMYYFPSLLNTGELVNSFGRKIILQPVLNWNRFPGYEGEWSIASWWVDNQNNAFHSPPVAASPGDEIFGFMNHANDGSFWYISTYNRTSGQGTDLYAPGFPSRTFDRSLVALESNFWDYGACKRIPGPCHFQNISFEDTSGNPESPEWVPKTNYSSLCPFLLSYDNTSVSIYTSYDP
jgi:hypothetical protein